MLSNSVQHNSKNSYQRYLEEVRMGDLQNPLVQATQNQALETCFNLKISPNRYADNVLAGRPVSAPEERGSNHLIEGVITLSVTPTYLPGGKNAARRFQAEYDVLRGLGVPEGTTRFLTTPDINPLHQIVLGRKGSAYDYK